MLDNVLIGLDMDVYKREKVKETVNVNGKNSSLYDGEQLTKKKKKKDILIRKTIICNVCNSMTCVDHK